ncbi:glycosyltransferase family 4 protein [candidate division KSB1 bacterium]|nr:glycosyltransferase family 4 protein [candidate division KSB1 bacterium]
MPDRFYDFDCAAAKFYMINLKGKKICFCLPRHISASIGGAELQTYLLAEEFVKNGWEVSFLTSYRKTQHPKYLNSKIRYFHYRSFPKLKIIEGFFIWLALMKIKAPYIYQRTSAMITGIVALFCRLHGRKMIWACASDMDCIQNFYQHNLKKMIRDGWNGSFFQKSLRYLNAWSNDFFSYFGKKYAHFRLAQTTFQQSKLQENWDLSAIIIPNGLIFPDREILFSQKKNYILWVGNIRPVKRPELFLKLVEMLEIRDWQFVMIGGCDDLEFKNKLKSMENIKTKFKYTGKLTLEETENYFRDAKIIINTSEKEGFSNTFLQAWIYKVCLLSMKVDPDQLISLYGLGFISKNDCLDEIITILNELVENEKKLLATIEKAYQYVIQNHSITEQFKKLEKLILEY